MEDMVVVAGRGCTNAVLVELVCAGLDHLDEGRAVVEFTAAHTRPALPWATASLRKARVASSLLHPSIQSSSCTDEDDIYVSQPLPVIARKLPCCYITAVIKEQCSERRSQRVAAPVISINLNHVAHFQDPLAGHPHSSETDWRT